MLPELAAGAIRNAFTECLRRGWLIDSAEGYKIASGTVREAFREAALTVLLERVHQELFKNARQQGRPLQECFVHLTEAPAAFIEQNLSFLIGGLRLLVANSGFTQVKVVLDRLRGFGLKLDAADDVELAVIEQELEWGRKATCTRNPFRPSFAGQKPWGIAAARPSSLG
jgi:hypothetical protein